MGESIGSTLFAYWLLGETLGLWKAAGGIRILASTYLALAGAARGVGLIISRERG
ncbi:MAG: hypothetical protein ACETWT_14600 [Thermodesulfobacteriota bacterium]